MITGKLKRRKKRSRKVLIPIWTLLNNTEQYSLQVVAVFWATKSGRSRRLPRHRWERSGRRQFSKSCKNCRRSCTEKLTPFQFWSQSHLALIWIRRQRRKRQETANQRPPRPLPPTPLPRCQTVSELWAVALRSHSPCHSPARESSRSVSISPSPSLSFSQRCLVDSSSHSIFRLSSVLLFSVFHFSSSSPPLSSEVIYLF